MQFGILKFRETYMKRIWGGDKLQRVLGRNIHEAGPIGEAWLIADHPTCESVVAEGDHDGHTLRELMETDRDALLGTHAQPTKDGRFPLLLKLIDAGDVLSVQVHPDDACALRLDEQDGGKTEMWHVLEADPESTLISGLSENTTRAAFEAALAAGDPAPLMRSFPVAAGDSVFVAAGAVHAIGAGMLLAEIQQNSDITYRLFDWNRVDQNGVPRALHLKQGLEAMDFTCDHGGRVAPLRYTTSGTVREVLAACPYFAAERIWVQGRAYFDTRGASFHIILTLDDVVSLVGTDTGCVLNRGEAALVPASVAEWHLEGAGSVLDYYVPGLDMDISMPLRRHGYSEAQIALLVSAD